MVLNNVTKFYKILIKTIRLRADIVGCDLHTDRRKNGRTGVTLNAWPLSWRGHTKSLYTE